MQPDDLDRRAGEIALRAFDLEQTCLEFDARQVVPYQVAAWSTHDPATGLFTSCTISGLEKDLDREAALFSYEFREDEPSTFHSLIREGRTVAILNEATGGDLGKAARYRELLGGYSCVDEIRAVFWADGMA